MLKRRLATKLHDPQRLGDLETFAAKCELADLARHHGAEPDEIALHHIVARSLSHQLDRQLVSDRRRDDDERNVASAGANDPQGRRRVETREAIVGDDDVPRPVVERAAQTCFVLTRTPATSNPLRASSPTVRK
ncbi:MAG TPA: hypothetical protein VF787_21490 [Thermoanaerobaculia bacterium]